MPFSAQCGGKLPTLHGVKWLLEEKHLVCRRNLLAEILGRWRYRPSHNDNIHIWVQQANSLRRLDSVDSRRHPNVHEYDRIRIASLDSGFDRLNRGFALIPGVYVELSGTPLIGVLAKQNCLEVRQCRSRLIRLESTAKTTDVFVDKHRIVVDDQHTICRNVFSHIGHSVCADHSHHIFRQPRK